MQPRSGILTIFFLLCSFLLSAQNKNPYESLDKKSKTLTLTKGQYDEFFDQDSIQQIGTALVNVNTMQVVKLLKDDEAEKLLDNSTAGRFLSVDPLQKKFPELTPYQFASNSPVANVDLDGREAYNVNIYLDEKGHYMSSGTPTFRAGLVQKWLGEAFGWSFHKDYYAVVYQNNKLIGAWNVGGEGGLNKFQTDEHYRNSVMGRPDVSEQEAIDRQAFLNDYNANLRLGLGLQYGLSRKQTQNQTPVTAKTPAAKTSEQTTAANNGNPNAGEANTSASEKMQTPAQQWQTKAISLSPTEINFSQRTVSGNVEQYVSDMKAGNWDWNKSGPIRIMEMNGKWVTYDNRRLMAAQQAGLSNIPYRIVQPNDIMPGSKKTWAQAFQNRFNDPRNVQAGGAVPDGGLSSQPTVIK